jgi:hypothetical protein
MSFDLKKISALPAAANIGAADIIPIVQGGVTKKTTFQVIQNNTGGGGGGAASVLTLDVSGTGSIELPEQSYIQALLFSGSDGSVKAGTTNGGTELVDDAIAGKPLIYSVLFDSYYPAGVTLYFEGNFTVKICLWNVA